VLLDGEMCGSKVSTLPTGSSISSTNSLLIGVNAGDLFSLGEFENIRTRTVSPDAVGDPAVIGVTTPIWDVDFNWPTGENTRFVGHFDAADGTVRDATPYGNHGIVPEDRRRWTKRGVDGWFDRAISFTNQSGGVHLPFNDGLRIDSDSTWAFFFKGYTDVLIDSSLISHGGTSDGYDIYVNTGGYLAVDVGSISETHTHSGALFGVNEWRGAWVQFEPTGGIVRTKISGSDWEESTFTGYDISAATGDSVLIGYGTWGYIDEATLHKELLDTGDFDNLSDRSSIKSEPEDAVYVSGVQVPTGDVRHTYHNRKYVVMPTGDIGDAAVWVEKHSKAWVTDHPYRYVDGYDRRIDMDTIEDVICPVKSPFRIGYHAPQGTVNLALVKTVPLSTANNVSLVDLSHLELGNISNYLQGKFAITGADTGDASLIQYPNELDTEDIRVSNISVMRKTFRTPRPLFYKYLLGRGRRYLYNADALLATDANIIRESLRFETREGERINIADYPWEIRVSKNDVYGNTLPDNVFSVVVYTEVMAVRDRSVFVIYDAMDALLDYKRDLTHREVVNPVPIFHKHAGPGTHEYNMEFNPTGFYDLTLGAL